MLVRSRQEAALIRDALTSLNIPSVYLSNRDSVFETLEAQEMLWVLQAVLAPERESTLRSALASSMLGLNARDIDALNCDEAARDAVVEEFVQYRERWQKRGVMAMLRELMRQRHIAENMLATAGGERRLTDILHISELLQEAGTQLESEHAWCAGWRSKLPIRTVTRRASRCVLRVINTGANRHHSQVERPGVSAGLAAVYRQLSGAGSGFYHDRESFDAVLDLSKAESSVELAEAERPAEDLRLLYVALTRSVWHCSWVSLRYSAAVAKRQARPIFI